MFEKPEEPIPWLVESLVEHGAIGFIGGAPKQTKSWLALHIAHAVATGNPVLGKFQVPGKRRVLYLQEEDGERMVRRRLSQLMAGHGFGLPEDEFFKFSVRVGPQIDSPEWIKALARECDLLKPDLIIADVLNKMHSKDENTQVGMSAVMQGFDYIRRRTGAAILIVHHFAKRSESRGNKNLRGSSVLSGASENSLYVYEEVKGKLFSVDFESKSMAMDPFKYIFEALPAQDGRVPIRLRYAGEDKENAISADMGKVLAALRDQMAEVGPEGCTVKELVPIVGLSPGTVRSHVRKLVQAKMVRVEAVRCKGQKTEAFVPVEVIRIESGEDPERHEELKVLNTPPLSS